MFPEQHLYFQEQRTKISIPWFILFFVLALVVNTYLLDGVPQLGAAINGIARKTLTITMFFIGASLSIDVLKAVGIKPLDSRNIALDNYQLEYIGIHLFCIRDKRENDIKKKKVGE